MFGYVNVYKDELKIKDYDIYRAYYCGLCKMLGKRHNQLSRLALNYDLTFLALITDSLSDEKAKISMQGCIRKFGKRKTVTKTEGLAFASDMNILLTYHKLFDDVKDNHSLKALVSLLPFAFRYKYIRRKYERLCNVTKTSLMRLSFLEETGCEIIDKVAHEFAVILKEVFSYASPELENLGYVLGRLIYILDACDDMKTDFKKKRYNPAIIQYEYSGEITADIKSRMTDTLYFTLSELAQEYKKLTIKKNKEIIDNIIFLGLRAQCDRIINERNTNNEKSI